MAPMGSKKIVNELGIVCCWIVYEWVGKWDKVCHIKASLWRRTYKTGMYSSCELSGLKQLYSIQVQRRVGKENESSNTSENENFSCPITLTSGFTCSM